MQNLVKFSERNGIVAMGGVQVPSGSLDVPVQSEVVSNSNE